jgi:hypothetical protein
VCPTNAVVPVAAVSLSAPTSFTVLEHQDELFAVEVWVVALQVVELGMSLLAT